VEALADFSLAENAFINAVVNSMKLQDELLTQHKALNAVLEGVAKANEAVLRDQGITEATPLEDTLQMQERYLNEAIERSPFAESDMVVKALRQQLAEMHEAYRAYQQQEAGKLGQIRGPVL
jgi:hypothetical protein